MLDAHLIRLSALLQTDNLIIVQIQKSRGKGLHKSEQGRYHFGKKTKDSENRRKPL